MSFCVAAPLRRKNYLHDFLDYFDCIVCCLCIYLPFRDNYLSKKLHSKDKIKRTTHQWACDASKFTQTRMKCGILGNSLMMHTYRRNGFGSACVLRGVRNSAKKISYPAYFLYIIIYNFFFRI